MEDRTAERIDRYLRKADEARDFSVQAERREVRRSLALLAAMWTALAKHAQRTSDNGRNPLTDQS